MITIPKLPFSTGFGRTGKGGAGHPTDFAVETAGQFLDTHLIRVHEWHLGELARLLDILSIHEERLLSKLAAATRTIMDGAAADEQGAVYQEFIETYYPIVPAKRAEAFRPAPISQFDGSSENMRLADQDQDERRRAELEKETAAHHSAMRADLEESLEKPWQEEGYDPQGGSGNAGAKFARVRQRIEAKKKARGSGGS